MSTTPKHLGQTSSLPESPEAAELDYVPNPRRGALYLVRFAAPEFTSLCPVTGQPDFAHLVIDYVPGERLVESKSLKLYLGSYRSNPDFHEACTIGIARRLEQVLEPDRIRAEIDGRDGGGGVIGDEAAPEGGLLGEAGGSEHGEGGEEDEATHEGDPVMC